MRADTIIVTPDDPRLSGRRVESWEVDVLDEEEAYLYTLSGCQTARATYNRYSTIRGGGYVSFVPHEGEEINFLRHRLRIWQYVTVGSELLGWPWITGVPQKPDLRRESGSDTIRVSLLDKMLILDEDKMPETFSLAAGANVTDAVRALIVGAGEASTSITDSPLALRAPMTWDPMTSRLRIINDLLDTIGYFSVWCDGMGTYRVEPYTLPADRPPVREFRAGSVSIHRGEWTRAQDLTSIPNRVILRSRAGYEEEGLTAVRENVDPSSPFSYQGRGDRWITDARDGVEAADQATLNAMADRIMAEANAPAATWEVQHATVPLLLNQNVVFAPLNARAVLCSVQDYTVTLGTGADVNATWQEVRAW